MTRTIATIAIVISLTMITAAQAEVIFDWAYIGNAGNGADTPDTITVNGTEYPYRQPNGAVAYDYHISKHEVTNSQYTEFLNAVDPAGANTLDLYDSEMSTHGNGGITLASGAADGSKYQVKPGHGNNPVVFVTLHDSMRFINWLDNGQGSGDTEAGVYTIGNGLDEVRSPTAQYFLPTADEWFKAAYHKNDGVTANYWKHATSTDTAPYSDQPPGSDAPDSSNTANFRFDDVDDFNGYNDGYAATGSPVLDSNLNYLTDVGAYSSSMSPYGVFDMAGNASERTETLRSSGGRDSRGGNWSSNGPDSGISPRFDYFVGVDASGSNLGFRVASAAVPEPGTLALAGLAGVALLPARRKRIA